MATQFLSLNDIRRSKSARNNPILKGSRKVTGANIQAPSPAPGQGLLITFDTDITTNQFGQSTVDVAFDSAANYSGLIEWADGTPNTVLSGTGNTGITHIFDFPPEIIVQVRVSGNSVPKFSVAGSANIISVENLGNVGLQDTESMFRSCNNLATASTGNYITSIGNRAFESCTVLATVDLSMPKSVIDGAANIFLNTASPLTLNVPTGTTGWTAGTGQSIGGNTNVTVNLV